MMKIKRWLAAGLAGIIWASLATTSFAQEQKADKAKPEKVTGEIGLLNSEKNYMIVVTQEGKLVTIDFNEKTKVTALRRSEAKIADIGLGASASVQYQKTGDRYYLTSIEFTPAKGSD